LNAESIDTYIPQLKARGVKIQYTLPTPYTYTPKPEGEGKPPSFPYIYIYIGIGSALGVGILAYLARRRLMRQG